MTISAIKTSFVIDVNGFIELNTFDDLIQLQIDLEFNLNLRSLQVDRNQQSSSQKKQNKKSSIVFLNAVFCRDFYFFIFH